MLAGALVRLRVELPPGAATAWRRSVLSAELERADSELSFDAPFAEPPLDARATVADLLALLRTRHEMHESYADLVATDERLDLHAVLATWSTLQELRPALVCAALATARVGGRARLAVLGELDGDYPVAFATVDDAGARAWTTDPQNVGEAGYREHFEDLEALEREHRRWSKKARKR